MPNHTPKCLDVYYKRCHSDKYSVRSFFRPPMNFYVINFFIESNIRHACRRKTIMLFYHRFLNVFGEYNEYINILMYCILLLLYFFKYPNSSFFNNIVQLYKIRKTVFRYSENKNKMEPFLVNFSIISIMESVLKAC